MFSYWSKGPTILGCTSAITAGFILGSSLILRPPQPSPYAHPPLATEERDRLRGWYGLEINGGPTQYHLTLQPLVDALRRDCIEELRQGDLIHLTLTSRSCKAQRTRLSGADLYALHIPLHINEASIDDLVQIRGIGEQRAHQVIQGRPWRDLEQLTKMKGVGRKTLNKLRPYLTVSPSKLLWPHVSPSHAQVDP